MRARIHIVDGYDLVRMIPETIIINISGCFRYSDGVRWYRVYVDGQHNRITEYYDKNNKLTLWQNAQRDQYNNYLLIDSTGMMSIRYTI